MESVFGNVVGFLFSVALYVQIGYQLGKFGWEAWYWKSRGVASFFVFPISWHRDKVGVTEWAPVLAGINPPEGAYRAAVLVLWPFLMLWNLTVVVAFLVPSQLIARLGGKKNARVAADIERKMQAAEEENRRLDKEIWATENEDPAGAEQKRSR